MGNKPGTDHAGKGEADGSSMRMERMRKSLPWQATRWLAQPHHLSWLQRGKTVEVPLSKLDIDTALCPVHVREFKRLLGMGCDELMFEAEGNA
jgi:hypothetical protein